MNVLMLVKVILWFADENLSACVWFHGISQVKDEYKDSYGWNTEGILDDIPVPALMEWCGEWKPYLHAPETYTRLMRKKSSLSLAADSQLQATFSPVDVSI